MTDAPGRRKRLSADLPQNWLHDPLYWGLSDAAWRLHTHALMWAIGRTDGHIPARMSPVLSPGTSPERDAAVAELCAAGVWHSAPGGWQVTDWPATQSTCEQIENNRRRERDKKRRQRASVPQGTPPRESPEGVRHGTARKSSSKGSEVKQGAPRNGHEEHTCADCGRPVSAMGAAQTRARLGRVLCSACSRDAFGSP